MSSTSSKFPIQFRIKIPVTYFCYVLFFLKFLVQEYWRYQTLKGKFLSLFQKLSFYRAPPPYCFKFLARSNAFNHKQLIFPDVSVLFFILSSIINFFQNLFCCCVGSYGFTTYTFTLCVRNMRIIPTWWRQ